MSDVLLFFTPSEVLEPDVEAEDPDDFSDLISDRSGNGNAERPCYLGGIEIGDVNSTVLHGLDKPRAV